MSSATAPEQSRRALRPEIQGLRSVAVLLVVGYHLFPAQLRGGYIGVDVFFVISGFLITGQITKEIVATGGLSLVRFWGRRIRRLLPAAMLVLAACLVGTWLIAPTTLWNQWLLHIAASAFYAENWALAADAVDYLAQGTAPTIVQHYWSLSVEEQFYIVWPIIAVVVVLALKRAGRLAQSRRVLLAVLAAVTLLSFAVSVLQTVSDPGIAYFSTLTRMWEFGAGALLAVLGASLSHRVLRLVLGWAGLAALAVAALLFDAATPFPGYAALLPVLGTVAVILAGSAQSRASAASLLSLRPVTFVGDISYSLYLWHWPLIVLAPYLIGAALTFPAKAVVAGLALVLAWATTRFVENPLRHLPALTVPSWRSFAAAGVAMAIILSGSLALDGHLARQRDEAAAAATAAAQAADDAAEEAIAALMSGVDGATAATQPCLGPLALDPAGACASPTGSGGYLVSPDIVGSRTFEELYPDCLGGQDDSLLTVCELGQLSGATRTIAVVGDSHATQWLGAFDLLGRTLGWKVIAATKASCPFADTVRVLPDETAGRAEHCTEVNDELVAMLESRGDLDAVFASAFGSAYTWDGDLAAGIEAFGSRLDAAGIPFAVIRDVPLVKDRADSPTCLESMADPVDCALPRSEALVADPYADAAASLGRPVLDLSDQFCDSSWCYAVVGGVVVYVDYSHLTAEYSSLLAPAIYRQLRAIGTVIPGL